MFTKEFIKISQILDHNGMHRQADDLLKIAQAKPPVQKKPVSKNPPPKPTVPTAKPALMINPTKQNERFVHYTKAINNITSNDNVNKDRAKFLKTDLDNQYNNNLLDYNTYKKLTDSLILKAKENNITLDNSQVLGPKDPTAFPVNTNEQPMMGRTNNLFGNLNAIQLATPVEGLTAAGEKALPNREDRNLPALVANWNEYLKTESFKDSIEARIKQMKADGQNTTQLEELLNKAKSKEGLKVGDFGNKGTDASGNLKINPSEVYGVEAKPLTTITGTPTTPAAGTVTTTTPVAPAKPAPNRS